jgi:hypothetical protein
MLTIQSPDDPIFSGWRINPELASPSRLDAFAHHENIDAVNSLSATTFPRSVPPNIWVLRDHSASTTVQLTGHRKRNTRSGEAGADFNPEEFPTRSLTISIESEAHANV